jgi:hypothetical protein
VAFQKNILKYLCSEKTTHKVINEGCHIDFYGSNMNSLLHSNISLNKILNNNNYGKLQEMTDLVICMDHERKFQWVCFTVERI